MEIETFKTQLKETIKKEFPGGVLEQKIAQGVEKHSLNFREYISLNPSSNFSEWKFKLENSVNTETLDPGELISIGIFLLALDEFNPDE